MSIDETLRDYLPNTQQLSKASFNDFLDRYGEVIIKPCYGFGGYGVILVTSLGNEGYQFHNEYKLTTVVGRDEAFNRLMEAHCKKRSYIVQQKIPLVEIEQCPFDIRVMVQRKSTTSDWVITGILTKVAEKGYVITNMAKEVLPINEALIKSNLTLTKKIDFLTTEVESISLMSANHLGKYYKKYRQIGFDIGIDQFGKVWIIEANLKPAIRAFKRLNDEEMIRKIREYRKGS